MNQWRASSFAERGAGLRQELVGFWDFNEGAGTVVNDRSGMIRPATVQGTTTNLWSATSYSPSAGSCLRFDGSTNFLNVTLPPLAPGLGFTFAGWMNTALSTAGFQVIVDFLASAASGELIFGPHSSVPNIFAQLPGTPVVSILATRPTLNIWTHQAITLSTTGGACLYYNGQLAASLGTDPLHLAQTWQTTLGIGARRSAALIMNGMLDDIGFWRRVLSAREIALLYNGGLGLPWPLLA